MNPNQLIYAGNLTPKETWERLQDDPSAVLIDVRTPEEWAYVGVPDITSLGRACMFVPWLSYPTMAINKDFVAQVLKTAKPRSNDTTILFICRSGYRSAFAAHALTEMGYSNCYNVAFGFEGDLDSQKRRGTINGWKISGLPWVQS
ncbi:rhodanese-like domain-containing protein [Magnetovibrio blakemorei]|uniref:Rhodanese domain-containing protein n=1 Tax=Magnetovibrio blakemorei TaxID=28181 RepID=A0A1E5Q842_9PROT|nr:rhodanese-like domain-containing protein [Magnetovibrio blakemorei]OEJ67530.1 hypothetical protein BEN30_08825 [Magnetovibrio blakemorei]